MEAGWLVNCMGLTSNLKVGKLCFSGEVQQKIGAARESVLFLPFLQKPHAEVTGKYLRINANRKTKNS